MQKLIIIFFIITTVLTDVLSAKTINSEADTLKNVVYVFSIDKDIAPAIWRLVQRSFNEADKVNADYIIISVNTYGGMVNMADSIRTKILDSPVPVFAFIENNAASAGALISIAADSIYMRKGARIGSASVVDQTGKIMPEKYQSYMRSTMRATAEAHGKDTIIQGNDTIIKWHRDPGIAEAMVDPRIKIEGISDTSTIIAFTAQEALKYGYCEAIVEDVDELIKHTGIKNYTIVTYEPTGLDKFIGFLLNPVVQGILIMLMIGGIYFELQTPGIGFPLGAAVFAATFYFAPLYLEGLAENWELIIFIAGLILIALEIFIIPGFGIAGISGIILALAGLVLAMIDNIIFDFEFHSQEAFSVVSKSLLVVFISIFASFFLILYLSKKFATSWAFSGLVLESTQKKEEGFVGVDVKQKYLIGKTGKTVTWLRPSGKIEIDNEIFDAISETGYIEKGKQVKVINFSTSQLYVSKID
ncbi:MAG: serine protease [Bacteroidetes bacterium GWC2_33_15]|nr:MAG: serine protease [Bacteroidetes bacterium GWA2_33_15]OFX51075.1 MAG: serine protease [Bacteroidetes bacterium GWC2_33_15]OFX66492.1 MAG: serine protease [Bacteroidetes bacterium GWB2_32_14]OFX70283.1 MAG: serine protease [Bacteroidetes bacterium GWD2_33_33]HAN17280.1 serine protease [Bacteroidales bacterium]